MDSTAQRFTKAIRYRRDSVTKSQMKTYGMTSSGRKKKPHVTFPSRVTLLNFEADGSLVHRPCRVPILNDQVVRTRSQRQISINVGACD
jgi:hypothetical protein